MKKKATSPKSTAPDFDKLVESFEWVRGLSDGKTARGVAFTGKDNQTVAIVEIERGRPADVRPVSFGVAAQFMRDLLPVEYKGGHDVLAEFTGWDKWNHQIAWRLRTLSEQLPHVENGNPPAVEVVVTGLVAQQVTERAVRAGLTPAQFISSAMNWKSVTDFYREDAHQPPVSHLNAAHLDDEQVKWVANGLRQRAREWDKIITERQEIKK